MRYTAKALIKPKQLYSRDYVLSKPNPVPLKSGVYAWYFRQVPLGVSNDDCHIHDGMLLLYVGISPRKPTKDGKASSENLRKRVRKHFKTNASTSTLRMSLGCLLHKSLGITLRRIGRTERFMFLPQDEIKLSNWMGENAMVCWSEHAEPWKLEDEMIKNFSLPLNLLGNEQHPFYPKLSAIRKQAYQKARQLPVIIVSK